MNPDSQKIRQNKLYQSLSTDGRDRWPKESGQNFAPAQQERDPAQPSSRQPGQTRRWTLPRRGIALFYGPGNTPRLSHYFLPRLLLEGKSVLFLDGANAADPRLLARLARERSASFERFNRQIEIARAFTCFQLTELIARVPHFLQSFPAEVLMITALPDLYFDEDVRDGDTRVTFEQALGSLRRLTARPLSAAIFSAATTFSPVAARKNFFAKVRAVAAEVWQFSLGDDNRPRLTDKTASPLSRGLQSPL